LRKKICVFRRLRLYAERSFDAKNTILHASLIIVFPADGTVLQDTGEIYDAKAFNAQGDSRVAG
jgi:hypothetical protein